ncbi:hypothetical protein K2173_009327 [Erythroxylum novogranatense]|uniref:Uncharacterized protein n=1 Tax=Erythroxylum novogranatense TaxID=1862640 RepID=A0AAV8U4W4_9ROSI|nr:hypothetical protein K2173_009327 [Erythroxylum novogranatense]
MEQLQWWLESLKGWSYVTYEILVQKLQSRHLKSPLPLPPLGDVTCVVTGSTSGIGLEIAKQLAVSRAHVVMAVRNKSAAYDLIKKWQQEYNHLSIEVMELNLLSLKSVVNFAEAWKTRSKPLQVLINNAGIYSIAEPIKISKDGYETHNQVNHLGPALLSILLLPSLAKGSPSRIINVNSIMHSMGVLDPNDLNFTSGRHKFSSAKAYANSKLAEVMFSGVLQQRIPQEVGISVVCVSPGSVRTNVARDLPKRLQAAYHLIPFFLFSPQEGARSALYAATDPQIPDYCNALRTKGWPVCAYVSCNCRIVNASRKAENFTIAEKVWENSLEMIGLPVDAVDKILQGKEVKCQFQDD